MKLGKLQRYPGWCSVSARRAASSLAHVRMGEGGGEGLRRRQKDEGRRMNRCLHGPFPSSFILQPSALDATPLPRPLPRVLGRGRTPLESFEQYANLRNALIAFVLLLLASPLFALDG